VAAAAAAVAVAASAFGAKGNPSSKSRTACEHRVHIVFVYTFYSINSTEMHKNLRA